jgi:hypothetical protein
MKKIGLLPFVFLLTAPALFAQVQVARWSEKDVTFTNVVVDGLTVYGLRSIESPPSVTLHVISMGGTTQPKVLSRTVVLKEHGFTTLVKVKNTLYLTDAGFMLFVINVADMARPTVSGTINFEREVTGPVYDGKDRLYYHTWVESDRAYRMIAVDVSDPMRPKIAGSDLAPDLLQNQGNAGDPLFYSCAIDYDRGKTLLTIRDASLKNLTTEPYDLPEGGGASFPLFRGAKGILYGLQLQIGGDGSLWGVASFDTTTPARPRLLGFADLSGMQPGFTTWDMVCASGGAYFILTDNANPSLGRILKAKPDAMQPVAVLGAVDFKAAGPFGAWDGIRTLVTPDRAFLYLYLKTGEVLLFKL